jgi:hypothetical protein
MTTIPDGIILLNTPAADSLGFTSALFAGDSYLWKVGSDMYISLIQSKQPGTGAFRALAQTLEAQGFTIKVPTPLRRMQEILVKQGYSPTLEEGCQVWVKESTKVGDKETP